MKIAKAFNTTLNTTAYRQFIREIKERIQSAQLKAAVSVNQELLRLYWDLAERIIARQQASAWGDGILKYHCFIKSEGWKISAKK